MIYHLQKVEGQKSAYADYTSLLSDTFNTEDNIHPQYNHLKSNYSLLSVESPLVGSVGTVFPFSIGRVFPFKILKDETIVITYDTVCSNPVSGLRHYVDLFCKGVNVFSSHVDAIAGTNSFTRTINIVGTLRDGYIKINAERVGTVVGSMIINNLIIS